MDAAVAEEMGDEAVLRKDPGEGSVADAEAAGIGAEGRHHGTHPVTGETAALHRATARGDARLRMQVAGIIRDSLSLYDWSLLLLLLFIFVYKKNCTSTTV